MRLPWRGGNERLLALLEEAARNASRAATLLHELLSAFPERAELSREILKCEQEGDRLTHDVIHRLAQDHSPRGMDARDLYELVRALDDVVDYVEETADSLAVYGVEAPMEQAVELSGVLARAAAAVGRSLEGLRGSDASADLVEVHELENEGDRLSRAGVASLFSVGTDPMVVIRWKDIFESLEQGIDSCESVAHVVEGIAIKQRR